jgi:hypothetical protein
LQWVQKEAQEILMVDSVAEVALVTEHLAVVVTQVVVEMVVYTVVVVVALTIQEPIKQMQQELIQEWVVL